MTYTKDYFSVTLQASSVSSVFTDDANTEASNEAATIGIIKGYEVMDISVQHLLLNHFSLKAGINNLADTKYTTRRSGGYPGPGILPANGRTFYFGVGVKF